MNNDGSGDVFRPRKRRRRGTSTDPGPDRPGSVTGLDRLFMAAPDLARRLDLATTDDRIPASAKEAAGQACSWARRHEESPGDR